MLKTILACTLLLLLVLLSLKLTMSLRTSYVPLQDPGTDDSPIVVADSSTSPLGGPGSALAVKAYPAHVQHPAFTLDSASSKGVVLVHDVIPGFLNIGIFDTPRKVSSFEVNRSDANHHFKRDLTQYKSWNLTITNSLNQTITFTSADNETVMLDPKTMPLSPSYGSNGWNLFNTGALSTVVLTDSHGLRLYPPPGGGYTQPSAGNWCIELHYCLRGSACSPPNYTCP